MAAPKRTQEQRQLDLAEMAKLLRRGWGKKRLARHFGLSPKQIRYDWKNLLAEVVPERNEDVEAARSQKLAEYEEVKTEAWDAWELSKQDKEKRVAETVTTTEGGGAPAGESRTKAVKQVEGRLPEHDYLNVVLKCLDAERELENLNPPKKISPTNPEGSGPAELVIRVVETVIDANPGNPPEPAPGAAPLPAE